MNATSQLHKEFCQKNKTLCDWFYEKSKGLNLPIYSSFDIRDARYKIANVDGNIYPAGFNNICSTDREAAEELMQNYLLKKYGEGLKRILLITEEHTQNANYWENISSIQMLLEASGYKVKVAFPRTLPEPLQMVSTTGKQIEVLSGDFSSPALREFSPQLVVSNNDFSFPYEEWAAQLKIPLNPARELGWYQRSKSRYFENYNLLAKDFAEVVGVDPFYFQVQTQLFADFDITEDQALKDLANRVDQMLEDLRVQYQARGLSQQPFLFIKNDSGTYGLAVIRVGAGSEVLSLNYKARKKMKAAKGGREVASVILQEGIPSVVSDQGVSAEPVIYMIGCDLAGGFLRTHAAKDSTESLNSPGAVYKKLCVSDLALSLEGSPLENVYGWVARLGVLAIGLEARQMGITY